MEELRRQLRRALEGRLDMIVSADPGLLVLVATLRGRLSDIDRLTTEEAISAWVGTVRHMLNDTPVLEGLVSWETGARQVREPIEFEELIPLQMAVGNIWATHSGQWEREGWRYNGDVWRIGEETVNEPVRLSVRKVGMFRKGYVIEKVAFPLRRLVVADH
jgi:hypothetical protein